MYETTRGAVVRVGADLARRVIQVRGVDAVGRRLVSRALKPEQFMAWCAQLPAGCLVAMEACSSAHHWARKLTALGLDARLIAANFVSPYRMEGKSGKNDMTDAAAISEAASRPSMRFVTENSERRPDLQVKARAERRPIPSGQQRRFRSELPTSRKGTERRTPDAR